MKFSILLYFILISGYSFAQSKPEKLTQSSQKENKKVEKNISKNRNFYQNQIKLNPRSADAWLNYYISAEESLDLSLAERRSLQSEIFSSSSVYIKNSWQYSLFKFIESGKKDSSALFNALQLTQNKVSIFPYVIQYSIIKNDEDLLKEYSIKLNALNKMSQAVYEYHYNTLMSADSNAIIYAKGLNDLVPLAILQNVYNIRTDIKLKYFDENIKERENVYLCISLGKEIISKYSNGVYSGLLLRLNGSQDFMEPNPEKVFKLSSLLHLNNLTEEELLMYRNYLPSFILHYNKLLKANDKDAVSWRDIIMNLGIQTGMQNSVETILNKNLH